MVVFLFWNIARKTLYEQIAIACQENDVDIAILAESRLDSGTLIRTMNSNQRRLYFEPAHYSPRLTILIRYPPRFYTPLLDDAYLTIGRLRPPVGLEVLIAAVHFPSKLHRQEGELAHIARKTIRNINERERQVGHQRTVVIGDFNLDPFEYGMTDADAFHAVMDRNVAKRDSRIYINENYSFFYNPMWSRLGDDSVGPPGTHYYDSGAMTNQYWHTLDQVLIRPALLDFYQPTSVQVITKIGGHELLRSGRLNSEFSDHLPVLVALSLEEGG